MLFPEIKARDTIERLAAEADPYSVTRADLVDAVRRIGKAELEARFAHDRLLANFVLNHWEFAHGAAALSTYPWNVAIPISDVCNARCGFCNSWLRGKRLLDTADLERFAPVLRMAAMVSLEGHGEPLVHPRFRDIVQRLRQLVDARCRTSIITNGLLLDEHLDPLLALGVNVFNVSLNAASPEVHEKVMGLGAEGFARVVESLRELARRGAGMEDGRRPAINLSLVVTVFNIHEIPQFIALAQDLGASQVNLRTLLPQTELLAGLNYHELPAYLAPDFGRSVAAAQAAIAAARVRVEADVASWSKPVFPEDVQARINRSPPPSVDRREAQRVVFLQKEDYKALDHMRSRGERLAPGAGDSRWTLHEAPSSDIAGRPAWYKCGDVYTTLHMNDFFFVLRPCCYMDAVPNHDVIKYDGSDHFFEAWNSPAMVSLRTRLREGPLYDMCRRCPEQPQYPVPEPREGDYETVPDAFGRWESHWTGEVLDRGPDGIVVVTPSERWAFAALLPLRFAPIGIGGRAVIDMQVVEGAVGICLLDRQDRVIDEIGKEARNPAEPVSLRTSDLSTVKGLIIRNWAAGGIRSRVIVRSVELQQRQDFGELIGYKVNREIVTLGQMRPTAHAVSSEWIDDEDEYETVAGANGPWEKDAGWNAQQYDLKEEGQAIVTPSEQWAYAAFMALRLPGDRLSRVIADLEVEEGEIGIGILAADGSKFVQELFLDASSGPGQVYLRNHYSSVRGIVVRNIRADGNRSRVVVRSIAVQVSKLSSNEAGGYLVNQDGRTLVGAFRPNSPDSRQREAHALSGLQVVGKPVPWALIAAARLDAAVGLKGPAVIRVGIHVSGAPACVGLIDKRGEQVVTQVRCGTSKQSTDIVIRCAAVEEVSEVVVRNTERISPPPVVLISRLEVAVPDNAPLH